MAIFCKEDVKGYYEQPDTWMSVASTTRYALGSNRGSVGANNQYQAKIFEAKTKEVVVLANKFFEEDWVAFKTYFQENPISLLADLEPVKESE